MRTFALQLLIAAIITLYIYLFWPGKGHAAAFDTFNVSITCTNLEGAPAWAAGIYLDDGTIQLRFQICSYIDRAIKGQLHDVVDVSRAAASVYVLSHELSHVLGTHDQNVTAQGEQSFEPDCVGWLLFPWVSKKLGISYNLTTKMMRQARSWGENSCRHFALPH